MPPAFNFLASARSVAGLANQAGRRGSDGAKTVGGEGSSEHVEIIRQWAQARDHARWGLQDEGPGLGEPPGSYGLCLKARPGVRRGILD